MHLFPLSQFGMRFGIDITVSDYLEAVSEASKAATNDLASRFRFRSFAAYPARRDIFFVRRTFDDGVGGFNSTLLLSRGLVLPGTTVAISTPEFVGIRTQESAMNLFDPRGDGINPTVFNAETGTLSVFGIDLSNRYVAVTYSGGLDVATDGTFEDVPQWLSETAMTQAALYLAKNRLFVQDGGEDLSELQDAMRRAFSEHVRYAPSGVSPMATEAV